MPDGNAGDLQRNSWRFLIDASESHAGREYAIYYGNEGKVEHIDAFAPDGARLTLEPDEVIFAYDDDRRFDLANNRVQTRAYQIDTGNGRRPEVLEMVADFDIRPEAGSGPDRINVSFNMTPYSYFQLSEQGFVDSFPVMYTVDITEKGKGAIVRDSSGGFEKVLGSFLGNMPVPPFHPGEKASAARAAIDERRPPARLIVLADDFNGIAPPPPPVNPKVSDDELGKALEEFCSDRTELARKRKLSVVAGREEEIRDVMLTLTLSEQASVCLIGDAGVGKTAITDGVAQHIADGDCPPALFNARVLQINLADAQANKDAMWRGQVENKVKIVTDGLAERGGWFKGQKIIYVFDELPAHLAVSGAVDKIKKMLDAPGVAAMATTTVEQFDSEVRAVDAGLARRFKEKIVNPASSEVVMEMLKKSWPRIRAHHGVRDMDGGDFEDFIAMTNRHASNLPQPARGKKALDLAAASARARGSREVGEEDRSFALAEMTGLSKQFIAMSDYERVLGLRETLPETILGQDEGLDPIARRLGGARGGLADPDKPLGAFLFVGPTGVGKTETAKQIALKYFGTMDAFAKIDMSQFMESHTVSRLIGAPAGYVGYNGGKAELYDPVRKHPGGLVLLLDEVEKAHPDVFNILLGILDDGKAADNRGRAVNFQNVVLVMTANLGAKEADFLMRQKKKNLGFATAANDAMDKKKEVEKIFQEAPKNHFSPEFIARMEPLGGIVHFKTLEQDDISTLVARELQVSNKRLTAPPLSLRGVSIVLGQDAMKDLVKEGFDPVYNARPVKGAVNRRINDPLGLWLLNPVNKTAVRTFARDHGGARLVIDALGKDVSPRLEPPLPLPGPEANDNGHALTGSSPPPASVPSPSL
jgi:ATP-dependent Clp protease ATP-binding subunit ClpA